MQEIPVIGIDHGFGQMKTINHVFPSRIAKSKTWDKTLDNVVEYNGIYYACGVGDKMKVGGKKTDNENYFILTMLSIAKELKSRGLEEINTVNIAAGLPLLDFKDDTYKQEFAEYLRNHGDPFAFKVDGEEFSILVNDVQIYAQGSSAIISSPAGRDELKKHATIWVSDMGSFTSDIFKVSNGKPDPSTADSIKDNGVRPIFEKVIRDIYRKYRATITEEQIEKIVAFGGSNGFSYDIRNDIIKFTGDYILKIIPRLEEYGYDRQTQPIIFVGGGATIIKNVIPPDPMMTVLDNVKGNVIGYELIYNNNSKKR